MSILQERQSAVLLALILILAAVFLFLRYSGDIIYSVYNKMTDTRMADTREQMQWERENFPKLDAWYEEGDYDSILAFCNEI